MPLADSPYLSCTDTHPQENRLLQAGPVREGESVVEDRNKAQGIRIDPARDLEWFPGIGLARGLGNLSTIRNIARSTSVRFWEDFYSHGGAGMVGTATVRLAQLGDEHRIDAFLDQHADSSLFLRSFLARGGLVDDGKPLQGTYAIALDEEQVVGVAMHSWNGYVYLQAPDGAVSLVKLAATAAGRAITGLGGPWDQVKATHLELGAPAVKRRSYEDLFALNLSDLVAPPPLGSAAVAFRLAEERDLDLLREWRFGYEVECTGLPETDTTRTFAARSIEGHVEREEAFLLEVAGTPVSVCTHNARVRDNVQVGGVWTPPELRGHSYARRVVAGSLQKAEREGMKRAVLFTENPAARRSYEALGFRRVGDFGVIILAT